MLSRVLSKKVTGIGFLSFSKLRWLSNRFYHSNEIYIENQSSGNESELLNDSKYKNYIREICQIPDAGHQLFVIQPDIKSGARRSKWSTAELRLQETCSLVETLPMWRVVGKKIVTAKRPGTAYIFGSGTFKVLTSMICSSRNVSAVLLSIDMLSRQQLEMLQKAWGVPVFDRYTIVLQIFKDHARTKESKLQIALAEIPFLRNRLNQFQDGQHDQQVGGAQLAGGAGQTYLHSRRLILQDREMKLRKALSKLENQRSLLRKERLKRKIPSIAVVGYTNSGKTTLIKALTGDSKLEPKDCLFATLDVTAHAGKLPNNMTALFMDTVGFISDIPTNLIDAFSATLEDAVIADVIVHVRDISHPDTESQKRNVLQTLSTMLPADKFPNIIEVCNKIDLCSSDISIEETSSIFISATSGRGLLQLRHEIQHRLIQATGQLKKKFKIPNGGPHLSWLYKEATVCGVEPHEDVEYLIVDTVISVSAYSKFKSYFSNSKYKDS